MHKASENSIPRREFLSRTALALAGVATGPALYYAFWRNDERDPAYLSEHQWQNLQAVQNTIFPSEPDSPGAADINAAGFFQWVLRDPEFDPEEKEYYVKGLDWLAETATEVGVSAFYEAEPQTKVKIITTAIDQGWGENWLAAMLTIIFEALLSDPIYGGNPNGIGWKWLAHYPGSPRPDTGSRYGG
jgi:gluconate 2-dehydrogenase gamma chain